MMTEALAAITEEEHSQQPSYPKLNMNNSAPPVDANKHPQGFPKNIERMFETFHQTPTGEFKPTFYNPFEIKHRRRTSKDQFSVLEASFQENSKPNATIRRALAQELGMTPRAVQVWFQNRRAKMKSTSGTSAGPDMSPNIASGTDTSANCSSLASPEYDHAAAQRKNVAKGRGQGRRHSMPNIQQAPIITNEHFKQLHEAIFGGHMLASAPHMQQQLQQQSLSYQVPMKPSQSFDIAQSYAAASGYYAPAYPQMHSPHTMKIRQASAAMPSSSSYMDSTNEANSPMPNDLDFFLQSIIVPPGTSAQQTQQQLFLSSLMQADPSQIPGLSENLASYLCPAPNGHGEPSTSQHHANGSSSTANQSDSYLLSKYMNDERFAD